jgi:hypothetical protein
VPSPLSSTVQEDAGSVLPGAPRVSGGLSGHSRTRVPSKASSTTHGGASAPSTPSRQVTELPSGQVRVKAPAAVARVQAPPS